MSNEWVLGEFKMKNAKFFLLLSLFVFLAIFVGCSHTQDSPAHTLNDSRIETNDLILDPCFTIENNRIYTEVANEVDSFDFNKKIISKGNYEYSIFKDREGMNKVITNVINLSEGDNIHYLLTEDADHNKTLYTVNVRRLPIHTVSLYYYDSYESSYWPDHYQEVKKTIEKKLYKTIQVQERDKLDLSKEKVDREGYYFLGWDYDQAEIIDDTSIYGLWQANEYTVTVINGSETLKYTATYGEYLQIDIPEKPEGVNDNYSFQGCSYSNSYHNEYYYFDRSGRFVSSADWQPIRFLITKDITVTTQWGY